MNWLSWFNSSDQVDAALVIVAVVGAIIEAGVAIAAVINVHKQMDESRKKVLEKYIEIFACVAAFFFLAEAILGWRSSRLLSIELEELRTTNLGLSKQLEGLETYNREMEAVTFPISVTNNEASSARLKPFSGTTWSMKLNGRNPNAALPMGIVLRLMNAAEWRVLEGGGDPNRRGADWSVGISVPTTNSDPKQIDRIRKAAIALADELYNSGAAVHLETNQPFHREDIQLDIGGDHNPYEERWWRSLWATNALHVR